MVKKGNGPDLRDRCRPASGICAGWECIKDVSAKFAGLFCVWKIYHGIVMVDSREDLV